MEFLTCNFAFRTPLDGRACELAIGDLLRAQGPESGQVRLRGAAKSGSFRLKPHSPSLLRFGRFANATGTITQSTSGTIVAVELRPVVSPVMLVLTAGFAAVELLVAVVLGGVLVSRALGSGNPTIALLLFFIFIAVIGGLHALLLTLIYRRFRQSCISLEPRIRTAMNAQGSHSSHRSIRF